MPIIVDEILISIEVTNEASGGANSPGSPLETRQEIVSECVERVMEILRQKAER